MATLEIMIFHEAGVGNLAPGCMLNQGARELSNRVCVKVCFVFYLFLTFFEVGACLWCSGCHVFSFVYMLLAIALFD